MNKQVEKELEETLAHFEKRRDSFDKTCCDRCILDWWEYNGVVRGIVLSIQLMEKFSE